MITGTPVPATGWFGRTQLYISERNISSEEYVTVTTRSDSRVDKLCEIARFCLLSEGCLCEATSYHASHHE